MKPSPLEWFLSLAGSLFIMLVVFHKSLGLSDDWEWPLLIAVAACSISSLLVQRHRRNARLAAGMPPLEKPPTKRRFWMLLILLVVASLSGPFWLPYTGVALPLSMLIVTSVISSALAVIAFILGWRFWNKKV
jgi:cytochrome b subunit of formate dehydrogenase